MGLCERAVCFSVRAVRSGWRVTAVRRHVRRVRTPAREVAALVVVAERFGKGARAAREGREARRERRVVEGGLPVERRDGSVERLRARAPAHGRKGSTGESTGEGEGEVGVGQQGGWNVG